MINFESKKTRKSAFAGSWYPANSGELSAEISQYLKMVEKSARKDKPRIIVSPHPGLIFGGPTQAHAYQEISEFKYRNVFLIGVSHYSYFQGIALADFDYFSTPLGSISVNTDINSFFRASNPSFIIDNEAHEKEHSLEVQTYFLKTVLKNKFKIVPILLSGQNEKESLILAEFLFQALTPDDLVIISTDLSHYPSYEDAKKVDKETVEAFLTLDREKFNQRMKKLRNEKIKNTDTFACGEKALITALDLANKLNLNAAKLLHLENSGNNSEYGDKKRVVGYAAIAIYSSADETFYETVNLTKEDQKMALKIARDSLENYFVEKGNDFEISKESLLNNQYGVFVTLTKNGVLRGCIGNFLPDVPLHQAISEMVLNSAFNDSRFSKLEKSELEKIKIEISVLSPLKQIDNSELIIPGKHGVYISKGNRGGTYLPQVASDQNWDREAMLNSLTVEKSGLPKNAWKDKNTELYTYTAQVFAENN